MSVKRKDGRVVVQFQAGGHRVFRRLPEMATLNDGKVFEAQLRKAIFHETLGKKQEILIREAIQLWLESPSDNRDKRNPLQNARHLAPFIKDLPISRAPEAAQSAIRAWTGASTQTPIAKSLDALSPATINRRLAVLKASLRYAWQQGRTDQNISGRIPKLREDNKREVYLTREEVTRLCSNAGPTSVQAAIMLAAYSGCRASELLRLTRTDLSRDTITVDHGKTGGRVVPISSSARPWLQHVPLGISYEQLEWAFRHARKKAGLDHVHFHDLRHTCASFLAAEGVDLYTIGKILGHATPVTTARYAHLTDKRLKQAMDRI